MATYYVDATGGLDGNAGTSEGAAWQTVAKVNGVTFSAGDTISFKRGETWAEKLTVPSSGSAGNPITFTAYGSGALPILEADTGRAEAIVLASGKTYVTISFLHCLGGDSASASGLIESASITNIVEDCTTDGLGLADNCISGSVTVRRCIIRNARDDGFTMHTTNTATVDDCYFYGNRDAINNSGTDMALTVTGCVFEQSGDGSGGFGDIGSLSETDADFIRCSFNGRTDGVAFKFYDGASAGRTVRFIHCKFKARNATGTTQPTINANTNVEILNCSLEGNGHGAIAVGAAGALTMTNTNMRNWFRFTNSLGGTCNVTTSVLYNPGEALTADIVRTGCFTTDPLFVDASAGNYRLQAGSPAINAGTPLGFTTDLAGRPVGNPPEIGAYEYGIWGSVTAGNLTVSTLNIGP